MLEAGDGALIKSVGYRLEPLAGAGLVSLAALDGAGALLALERAWSPEVGAVLGHFVALYYRPSKLYQIH